MGKTRLKKRILPAVAAGMAGVLGIGAMLQTQVAVQASSAMMPGIETIVNETSEEKPFRILEVVDSVKDAEIGWYVSGQEPYLKLYQYLPEGAEKPITFSSLEEGLSKLPTARLREEFMKNIKLTDNGDGTVTEGESDFRSVYDLAWQEGSSGNETTDYPLSYQEYQERYFLDEGESEEQALLDGWKRVDFSLEEGEVRTDTVSGHFRENAAGTGDYTQEEKTYYPIRSGVPADQAQTEKFKENIQSFFFSEGDGAAAPYQLEFEEVSNDTVNKALTNTDGSTMQDILGEYDFANGKYGYFENVYGDLTEEIVKNIKEGLYTFPGENPGIKGAGQLVVSNLLQTVEAFDSGMENDAYVDVQDAEEEDGQGDNVEDAAQDETVQDETVQDETVQDGAVPDAPDTSDPFSSGDFSSGDGEVYEVPGEEQSTEEPGAMDVFLGALGDVGGTVEVFAESIDGDSADVFGDTAADNGTVEHEAADNGEEIVIGEAGEEAVADVQAAPVRGNGQVANKEGKEGTQEDPFVYLGSAISEFPYYQYETIGDLDYIRQKAAEVKASDVAAAAAGKPVSRQENDITIEDGQYWIWQNADGGLQRELLSIVTGRQAVPYSEITHTLPDMGYNYYFRVKSVFFCCELTEGQTEEDPTAYSYFGWYYPSYPKDGETYLPAAADDQTATHYVSSAQYRLTPGEGNYDFIPGTAEGVDEAHKIPVNHLYYQGGFTNHDWLKRYVFHLSPDAGENASEEEQKAAAALFEKFRIEVDTLTTEEFAARFAGGAATASEPVEEVFADGAAPADAEGLLENAASYEGVEEVFADGTVSEDSGEAVADVFSSGEETDTAPAETVSGDMVSSGGETPESAEELTDLGEYDLIYLNGSLGTAQAEQVAAAGVPVILNQGKDTAGSFAAAFAGYRKETDADSHYVTQNVYFFNAKTQGSEAVFLANRDFHTDFNPETSGGGVSDGGDPSEGFEEILEYIESENQYRSLGEEGAEEGSRTEPLTAELSQARAVEYIINYQYKRLLKTKDKIHVLEIQPAKPSQELTEKQVLGWLGYDTENAFKSGEDFTVETCCGHTGEDAQQMLDGSSGTIWHSAWEWGDRNYQHEGKHVIKILFSAPKEVGGFIYLPRQDGNSNGKITEFAVDCYDQRHQKLGDTETGSFQASWDKQSFRFSEAVRGVSSMEITVTADESGQGYAAIAELTVQKNLPEVTVTSMTASEFAGHIEDISSEYDMIYIGDDGSNRSGFINGAGAMLYTHVGAGVQVTGQEELIKLMGQLDNDFDMTWTGVDGKRRFAPLNTYGPDGAGYYRGTGNDMTRQQCEELVNFVKSGYPVILAPGIAADGSEQINESVVDKASYYYQFLSQAILYKNVAAQEKLEKREEDISFFSNLSKPVIRFAADGGKPLEPPRAGEADDGTAGYIDGKLQFVFTVENDSEALPAAATYDCNLYLDLNFDGNLSEKEGQDKYMVITDSKGNALSQTTFGEGDSRYELKAGETYTLTRKIPQDYFKLITWKLEISNNSNTYIHTSEIGYAKQENHTGTKQVIKVLQILPDSYGTWNLASDTRFKGLLGAVPDFDIQVEAMNIHTFANLDNIAGKLNEKQMLIIGFGDAYQDIPNDRGQVNAILDFVKSGKSIIFAHDTTSFINYDYNKIYPKIAQTAYGVDENVNVERNNWLAGRQNLTWGLSLNTVLRSVVGMDRYGITSGVQIGSNGETISQLLKQSHSLDSSSVSFETLMQCAGDIAYQLGDRSRSYAQTQGYTNGLLEEKNLGSYTTTSVTKVNDGAITQYPYRMADSLPIAKTHGQYYQLALEQDRDINGNSDGKTDVVVWYCLSGGEGMYYDKSPNDVRNNYYFYSKGNVIYTGAGHSTVGGDAEVQLFINAIVAAANVTAVQPEVNFVNALNPAAETESTRYYMTDQASWTGTEGNVLEPNMDFYINVKDYNMVSADLSMEDLNSQDMTVEFYMEDENGNILLSPDMDPSLPSELKNKRVTNITPEVESLQVYGREEEIGRSSDGKFHLSQNNAYGLRVKGIEQYLRTYVSSVNQSYKSGCRLYAKVSSKVFLYGQPTESTSWAWVDLKQRQLFDMD